MKRTKKSQKKTKFLLILIVLTAILSITATYAWFSTQKDVEISTMRLNIEVAESLEISLDGKTWTNTITISDMRQFYGTAASGHQAAKTDNTNYVPKQLLPVSTTGSVANGKLQLMYSSAVSGTTIKATACDEATLVKDKSVSEREAANSVHPYLVFDMYLKNLSAQTNGDALRLATGSRVWTDTTVTDEIAGASTANTGAENAMRVGFVQYMDTLPATTATTDGANIRALTPSVTSDNNTPEDDDDDVTTNPKVAIWEPNDLDHIQEVVNNDSRVSGVSVHVPTYGVKHSASEVTFEATATVSATPETDPVALQNTVKPVYTNSGDTPGTTTAVPLVTTGTASAATTATGDIILPKNTISKFRVYVWLEGQDVDCINTASMAGKLDVKIRLDKVGGTNNGVSYAADASQPADPDPDPTP